MSYARFGADGGSSVYIFPSDRGLECCGCPLPGRSQAFFARTIAAMEQHIADHLAAGQFVPGFRAAGDSSRRRVAPGGTDHRWRWPVSTVSETTHTTLHNLLRVVASGTVIRSQSTDGGWTLTINDQTVTDEEIQLAVSVLDAKHLITWWPAHKSTQKATLTISNGNGMATLTDWDHRALLGGRHRLRLELINDSCHSDGDGDEAA